MVSVCHCNFTREKLCTDLITARATWKHLPSGPAWLACLACLTCLARDGVQEPKHCEQPPCPWFTPQLTAEYCTPVWCRSAHTRLIDIVLNDALRIVTGCPRPTPTDYLPILAGIQPAELRRRGATLSLANRATLNPAHILHEQLVGKQNAHQGRLKSRRPFVPAAQKLLDSLTESDIRAAQWMDYVWNLKYLKSASRLHGFIPRASPKPLGMGLPRTSWVKLNRLRTGVGRFHSSMYKWGVAPSPNCECGASEQTADHIISTSPLHRAPKGIQGLLVLDDDTRRWLKINDVNI